MLDKSDPSGSFLVKVFEQDERNPDHVVEQVACQLNELAEQDRCWVYSSAPGPGSPVRLTVGRVDGAELLDDGSVWVRGHYINTLEFRRLEASSHATRFSIEGLCVRDTEGKTMDVKVTHLSVEEEKNA